jgi:hypothetical protein
VGGFRWKTWSRAEAPATRDQVLAAAGSSAALEVDQATDPAQGCSGRIRATGKVVPPHAFDLSRSHALPEPFDVAVTQPVGIAFGVSQPVGITQPVGFALGVFCVIGHYGKIY